MLGVAQALALQPGVSRSGVTMTAARVLTFDRETAARFSFLLSLPVIAGAVLYKGLDLAGEGIPPGMGGPFVAGIVASAVSGFLVIAFLLRYLRVHDFALFLWIRVAVAALIFVVIATGARPRDDLRPASDAGERHLAQEHVRHPDRGEPPELAPERDHAPEHLGDRARDRHLAHRFARARRPRCADRSRPPRTRR